jgi:hypothetical protein
MDAGHTVRSHATFISGELLAHFISDRKRQPERPVRAAGCPGLGIGPVTHKSAGTGRGRKETRTIQVLDAPENLPFPHVSQACLIERHVTALDGTPLSEVAALGVTSLDATRAGPGTIAGLGRGQRAIYPRT